MQHTVLIQWRTLEYLMLNSALIIMADDNDNDDDDNDDDDNDELMTH